jgi:hypothetical protein
MEIAPGYRVGDWKNLNLEKYESPDWPKAVEIFETRIRRRFLDPVDVLIAHEVDKQRGTFGFSIMAIDCLVIETLQGFREGKPDHNGKSKDLFVGFLKSRWAGDFGGKLDDKCKATMFYERCRCSLHHSGQTDGELRLQRSGPMIQFESGDRIVVNRTAFHEAVKCEFNRYLGELLDGSDSELRENFCRKMSAICGIGDAARKESKP